MIAIQKPMRFRFLIGKILSLFINYKLGILTVFPAAYRLTGDKYFFCQFILGQSCFIPKLQYNILCFHGPFHLQSYYITDPADCKATGCCGVPLFPLPRPALVDQTGNSSILVMVSMLISPPSFKETIVSVKA